MSSDSFQGGRHVTFPGRGAIVALCALLASGCEDPKTTAIKASYEAALKQARADCTEKGGEEFLPYGTISWIGFVSSEHLSDVWRCRRFEKFWKRPVAVYVLKLEGTEVKVEIR